MKKIIIACALLALIAGCTSQRKCVDYHPTKKSHQLDVLPDNKENRFAKQFQRADSMFTEEYGLNQVRLE